MNNGYNSVIEFKDEAHMFWHTPHILIKDKERASKFIKYFDSLKVGDIIDLVDGYYGIVIDNRWRAGYLTTLIVRPVDIKGYEYKYALYYAEIRLDAIKYKNDGIFLIESKEAIKELINNIAKPGK